jgi:hypothetical protein
MASVVVIALSGVLIGQTRHGLTSPELVYVANADAGPVTAYSTTSTGAVAPLRQVKDPKVADTFWDPWGVAFDHQGNLYVQTFLSDATTLVFPPSGSDPTRIFTAISPDVASVAVDRKGYEYLIGGEGPSTIAVEPPGANGTSSSFYHVAPLRQIPTDATTYNTWPSVLATDAKDEIVAAITRTTGNAIEVYQGGAAGPHHPLRVISGPDTGLGACAESSNCDHVSVTTKGAFVYALVSNASGVEISVFRLDATGDVAPIRTISGPSTGLNGLVGTGIAVSTQGQIFVLVKTSQFSGSGQIEVFAAGGHGDVAPIRSFTDASTHLAHAQGIALGG